MYGQPQSTRIGYQQVINRKEDEVRRWASKYFAGDERYRVLRDPDSISLRVEIFSPRAKDLLLKLHADVFPTFTKPEPSLQENGEWIAWFGYSEPWPSRNYVTIQ
jgi:hypothetical protein